MLSVLLGSIVATVLGRQSTRPWYAVGDHVSRARSRSSGPWPRRSNRATRRWRGSGSGSPGASGCSGWSPSFAIPVGVGTAVFLEEFAPPGRIRRIDPDEHRQPRGGAVDRLRHPRAWRSSSGPSAPRRWRWARRSGPAALTLSLLVLPVIVIATQEALRTVPNSLRQAALALGATRWQMVRDHVLPAALPGILTGTILGLSQGHRRDGAAAHGRRRRARSCACRAGPPIVTPPCRSRSTITPRSRAPSSRPWPPEAS